MSSLGLWFGIWIITLYLALSAMTPGVAAAAGAVAQSDSPASVFRTDFGAVSPGSLPPGWSGAGRVTHDEAYKGVPVLYMEDRDTGGYAELRSAPIAVKPGERFELRGTAHIDDPSRGGNVSIFVRELQENGATRAWHYLVWPKVEGWTAHSLAFTTGSNTNRIQLYFYPASHGANHMGSAWFAQVELWQMPQGQPAKGMLWPVPENLKPDFTLQHPRVLYTPASLERARQHLAPDGPAWAKRIAQAARNRADRLVWMGLPDQALRDLVPKPNSYYMYGGVGTVCPDGSRLTVVGWSAPGKVRCGSGLILPNADYPDDGTGWKDAQGKTHYFVARWNGFVIDELTSGLEPLAYAYVLYGDQKYAHTAAVVLDAIASIYPMAIEGPLDYPGLAPGQEGGRLERPYYQVARRLLWYVNAVDLLWNSGELDVPSPTNPDLTIKENVVYNLLLNGADYAFREAHKPGYVDALHNGTADYNKAILAVGSLLGIQAYVDWAFNGPTSIGNMIANNIDRDGNYYETSALYSEYTMGVYLEVAEILYHLRTPGFPEGINLYRDPQFERMYIGAKQKNTIAGRLPAYGDTSSDTKVGTYVGFDHSAFAQAVQFYARAETEAKRRVYAQAMVDLAHGPVESRLNHIWQLFHLDHVDTTGLSAQSVTRPSEVLGGKGLVFLRSGTGADQRGAVLRYGATLNHGQRDELAILFYADGRELSFDPGYSDAHYRYGWQHHTVSHITTVVNEKSQLSAESAGGSLHFFSQSEGLSVVEASNPGAYAKEGVSLYRRLLALIDTSEESSYLVDIFRIRGGGRRDYSFHAVGHRFATDGLVLSSPQPGSLASESFAWGNRIRPDGRIDGYGHQPYGWNPPPGNGYGFLTGVQRAQGDALWRATWSHRDGAGVQLTMLPQPERQIIVADGPAPMGVKYVLARDEGDGPSQFVSVIEPFTNGPQIRAVTPLTLGDTEERDLPAVAFVVQLEAAPAQADRKDYFLSVLDERLFSANDGESTFATDAAFARVRRTGDQTESLHMTLGTRLMGPGMGIISPQRAFMGTVVAVDPENGSLLLSFDEALPQYLAGVHLLIDAPEYSHNSPYMIQRMVQEDPYVRVFLDPSTLVLARGKLSSAPTGNVLPNLVDLPYARNVTREGPNRYFDGKQVVSNRGGVAVIERVVGNYNHLRVDDVSGFASGDELTIHDVKVGDTVTIPVSVSLVREVDGQRTYGLTAPCPVWLALPETRGESVRILTEPGEWIEPQSSTANGLRLFWIEPHSEGPTTVRLVPQ